MQMNGQQQVRGIIFDLDGVVLRFHPEDILRQFYEDEAIQRLHERTGCNPTRCRTGLRAFIEP